MAKKKDYGFVPDKHGFVPDETPETSGSSLVSPEGKIDYRGAMQAAMQEGAQSPAGKFLMPMAGGMAGAPPGAAIGAAAGTPLAPFTAGLSIPVGATIGGMIGAGAGTAGMEGVRQDMAGEQINPQELMKQGGIAALTEPLGLVLGPGIAGVKAIKGAGGFAAAGKRFLGGVTEAVAERFPGAAAKLETVHVGRRGYKQLTKQLNQVVGQHRVLVQAATAAGVKAGPHDFMQPVTEVIKQLDEAASPLADKVRKRAAKFLARFGDVESIPASRVLKIKQGAQDGADNLWRQQTRLGGAGKVIKRATGKTAEHNFQEALARGTREWLEANVPGSGPLNQETQSLIGAREALRSPASRAARKGAARLAAAATTAALPGGLASRAIMGGLGYGAGHMIEPFSTPVLGAGLDALQNPGVQNLLGQLPRAAGLGFNQALSDQ